MLSTIIVPQGFSYVAAALVSIGVVLEGQALLVFSLRRAAGIKYPQLYAERAQVEASKDALKFNCAQRTHANILECMPIILITTLITSLKYPVFAATVCGLWSLSRVEYTRGYVTGDPNNRYLGLGILGSPALISLLCGSIWTVVGLVRVGI